MATIPKALYDTDFVEWTAHTAELLRQGRFDEVDREHVAEEIEDLGKRECKEARSELRRILMRLIERKIQPESAAAVWRGPIMNSRYEIRNMLDSSPSVRQRLAGDLAELYREAVQDVLETADLSGNCPDLGLPGTCPFTLSQLLEDDDLDSLRI